MQRVPTVYDVRCAIDMQDGDERERAIRKLDIAEVILDTDMFGSVCVGVLRDGTIFVDADEAAIADATVPRESLADTVARIASLAGK